MRPVRIILVAAWVLVESAVLSRLLVVDLASAPIEPWTASEVDRLVIAHGGRSTHSFVGTLVVERPNRLVGMFLTPLPESGPMLLEVAVDEVHVTGEQVWRWSRTANNTTTPGSYPVYEAEFWMSSVAFFTRFADELGRASVVASMPAALRAGRMHERVLVTWGDGHADRRWDQYVAWLDPDTSRFVRLDFTIRDAHPAAAGSLEVDQWSEVNGIWLPTQFSVGVRPRNDLLVFQRFRWRDVRRAP